MSITVKLDRTSLEYLITKKLYIPSDDISKLSDNSLALLWETVSQKNNKASKVKIGVTGNNARFNIPEKVAERLDLEYGDRFNIKVNSKNKEVIFVKEEGGKLKLRANNVVHVPSNIISKGFIKIGEYSIVTIRDEKIIYKSISYF